MKKQEHSLCVSTITMRFHKHCRGEWLYVVQIEAKLLQQAQELLNSVLEATVSGKSVCDSMVEGTATAPPKGGKDAKGKAKVAPGKSPGKSTDSVPAPEQQIVHKVACTLEAWRIDIIAQACALVRSYLQY
jgi:hypothetical protein